MEYSQQYSIILDLETRLLKRNLALGYVDSDLHISKYALQQLHQMFPSTLYDVTETLFSYVFSLKRDIPAKDILVLRNSVRLLMGLPEDDISDALKGLINSSLAELVAFAQKRYVLWFAPRYDTLRWRTYKASLSVYRSPDCKYPDSLEVERGGIQIYLSDDFFAGELYGALHLLENPLRKILSDSMYKNIISVRIEDSNEK